MGETTINNITNLQKQGESVTDSSTDFIKTIKNIYEVYDELNEKWSGEKATECKNKIEKLREPLNIIAEAIGSQGNAVAEAAQEFERFERS